jgi:hypothetical protein
MGEESAVADLVDTLVANKVRFTALEDISTGLEEVFLRLTKGEVA